MAIEARCSSSSNCLRWEDSLNLLSDARTAAAIEIAWKRSTEVSPAGITSIFSVSSSSSDLWIDTESYSSSSGAASDMYV